MVGMTRLLLAIIALSTPLRAQPIISPEIHADHRVTFRLNAPGAKDVQVRCESVKESAMQKDTQGVWSFTTPPLEPDIYAYWFTVDGLRTIDPGNPLLKYNLLNTISQVHVPGPKSLPWEINDVPRGVVHRHFYKSVVAGDERDFLVYTPPGYDPAARTLYPVLYLLHGFSDETTAWTSVGCANVILDNLIARGQAKPMIVVMPLGYGTMEYVRSGWDKVRRDELREANFRKFRETLLGEVIPRSEAAYRIASDREEHAIAGLSMGGAEALLVGLNALDRFAWIGAFSTGGMSTNNFTAQFPKLDEKANHALRLLWIACGKGDSLFADNERLVEWFKAKGVQHTWVETSGAHNFRVWRRNLAALTPLLFQETKPPAKSRR